MGVTGDHTSAFMAELIMATAIRAWVFWAGDRGGTMRTGPGRVIVLIARRTGARIALATRFRRTETSATMIVRRTRGTGTPARAGRTTHGMRDRSRIHGEETKQRPNRVATRTLTARPRRIPTGSTKARRIPTTNRSKASRNTASPSVRSLTVRADASLVRPGALRPALSLVKLSWFGASPR